MDAHESRLTLAICTGVFAFTAGIFGFALASDQVKTRVDRRVDRRVCQLVPASCPPPAPARTPGGQGD